MMALNTSGSATWSGGRGARRAASLLGQTERLLGTILLGNNIANTALTAIVTALAIRYFGDDDRVILVATTVVALLLIVFCEITPKVIGATFPERIALPASYPLSLLMRALAPAVWAVNLPVGRLLRAAGVSAERSRRPAFARGTAHDRARAADSCLPAPLDPAEPPRPRADRRRRRDGAAPPDRGVDLATDPRSIREAATCFHNKLPVFEGEINRVVGMLHVRRALGLLQPSRSTPTTCAPCSPSPTCSQRHAGVPPAAVLPGEPTADRAGDRRGTARCSARDLEDIIEESSAVHHHRAGGDAALQWVDDEVTVDGSAPWRAQPPARHHFRSTPRTLNGLLLETCASFRAATSVRTARWWSRSSRSRTG